jgi:multidrug efflux pump subunit AcrA (membrane-fusion protein)
VGVKALVPDPALMERTAHFQIGGWTSEEAPFEVVLRIEGAHWVQAFKEAPPALPEFGGRIAKDGQLELQAKLSEDDLAQIAVGIPASVTPVGVDRVFNGNIWQISPMIDAQSRQGMARIALAFDPALRPGGFASVEIKSGAMTAPVLPESAVQTGREGSFVYIVGKNNKAQQRLVKLGPVTANGLIIEEGLDGTERVVLYAGGFLNPDETINPKLLKKQ